MTPLTPRQLEVLARLAGPGAPSRREVANAMGVTEHTIKNHISNAFARLGVESLVGAWQKLGWLVAPSVEVAREMGVDRSPTARAR